jgi:hypothetical protein
MLLLLIIVNQNRDAEMNYNGVTFSQGFVKIGVLPPEMTDMHEQF